MYCIVMYCILLYCIVLYCFVLYCIAFYCIGLYWITLQFIAMYASTLQCIHGHHLMPCSRGEGAKVKCADKIDEDGTFQMLISWKIRRRNIFFATFLFPTGFFRFSRGILVSE